MLVILSGLPGVGKTTIARELALRLGAVHVRIDSIEQALRQGGMRVEGEGYRVAYAVCEDNLRLGQTVIADCVNPWPLTRIEWRRVAECAGVNALEVELFCSDPAEHRRRVESRTADLPGHQLPTWSDVLSRDYRPWDTDRLTVDTARLDVDQGVETILRAIQRFRDPGARTKDGRSTSAPLPSTE
jgi:predicted kinase